MNLPRSMLLETARGDLDFKIQKPTQLLSKNIETNSLFQMMIMVIFQQVVMVKKAMILDFVVRNGSQIQYWITKCPTDYQILRLLSQSI